MIPCRWPEINKNKENVTRIIVMNIEKQVFRHALFRATDYDSIKPKLIIFKFSNIARLFFCFKRKTSYESDKYYLEII